MISSNFDRKLSSFNVKDSLKTSEKFLTPEIVSNAERLNLDVFQDVHEDSCSKDLEKSIMSFKELMDTHNFLGPDSTDEVKTTPKNKKRKSKARTPVSKKKKTRNLSSSPDFSP